MESGARLSIICSVGLAAIVVAPSSKRSIGYVTGIHGWKEPRGQIGGMEVYMPAMLPPV